MLITKIFLPKQWLKTSHKIEKLSPVPCSASSSENKISNKIENVAPVPSSSEYKTSATVVKPEENKWVLSSSKKTSQNRKVPTNVQRQFTVDANAFQALGFVKRQKVVKQASQTSKPVDSPIKVDELIMSRAQKKHSKRALSRQNRKQKVIQDIPTNGTQDEVVAALVATALEATAATTVTVEPKEKKTDKVPRGMPSNVTEIRYVNGDLCTKIPYGVLTSNVLSFLTPDNLARFACCSKRHQQMAEEGYLWRSLFAARYPISQLTVKAMKDWRLAYLMQVNTLVEKLRCFHTKQTIFEDVIGIPIKYTVNPKSEKVDYIYSSMDLMSSTAYFKDKIRTNVWGENFQLWLPLYFTESHFQKALPFIKKTIVRLCPDFGSEIFKPDMVLDVLPKLMNTFVVLLSDEGVAASRKSFEGLTAIHRLFLALVHEYPHLQATINTRLKSFMAKEENRHKHQVPSLGNILPLLAVANGVTWQQFKHSYLTEAMDRAVIWICKEFPSMASTHGPNGTPESVGKETQRVKQSFEAMKVSNRLCMFQVFFLTYLCQGTSEDRANRYDRFFGQPEPEVDIGEKEGRVQQKTEKVHSPYSLSHFQSGVTKILAVSDWPEFFAQIQNVCPSRQALASLLRQSVKNSLKRGYHNENTNFAGIQASGVSTILKKGQSHAVTGMQRLEFIDHWSYQGGTKYLDATCFLYSETGTELDVIDFRSMASQCGSVSHSGDVMTGNVSANGGGTHTIGLNLQTLSADVKNIVFVVSAYSHAKLSDIINPSLVCRDPSSNTELCRYDLERHNKVDSKTAVVMCQLYKSAKGWCVLAVGESCTGGAHDYAPIRSFIQTANLFKTASTPA